MLNVFICALQNFEPMFESQERIDILKCKILQHIENSTMDVSSELQIFEAIAKKYRMKTITNYGKAENISYNGVLDRIKRKHCASFRIDTVTFCCM